MINEQINDLWLGTDLHCTVIAAKVGVSTAALSRYLRATFTEEQRRERNQRMQSSAQSVARVSAPPWYTGAGKSVPLRTIKYCEAYGITQLPPGTTVIMLDGDNDNFTPSNMVLMASKEAKKLLEIRTIAAALSSEEDTSGLQF